MLSRNLAWVRLATAQPFPNAKGHEGYHLAASDVLALTDGGPGSTVTAMSGGRKYEYSPSVVAVREVEIATASKGQSDDECTTTASGTTPDGGKPKTQTSARRTPRKRRAKSTAPRVSGRSSS